MTEGKEKEKKNYVGSGTGIPKNANNRTLPSWLFGARLSARERLTSSRPDAILVSPSSTSSTKKSKLPTTPHLHQVSQPRQSSRDVRRVHELNINMREIHLVKYCEDTRGSKKQHEILCKPLKAKKVILHMILLGVGGSIYTRCEGLTHLESPLRARP